MFCMQCGTQLPDGARFCMSCGTSLGSVGNTDVEKTKLVPAKCTSCGAQLEVDSTQQAAICPYCNSAYIVEQAINNFQVNMSGNMNISNATINVVNSNTNLENLFARAEEYKKQGNYVAALEYYNRVLDEDITHYGAKQGVAHIENEMENYVYYQIAGNKVFTSGMLMLKKGKFVFRDNKGKETVYDLMLMKDIKKSMGTMSFMYPGKFSEQSFGVQGNVQMLIDYILQAQRGIYPEMCFRPKSDLEEHIIKNYQGRKVEAIKYYRERTGVDLLTAKNAVDKIL